MGEMDSSMDEGFGGKPSSRQRVCICQINDKC